MQKAKLLKLAKFLREYVRDGWFDLGHWAEKGFSEKKCGTTACALGWTPACFPESGFKLEEDKLGICPVYKDSNGNRYEDFKAGQKFYGLTKAQSFYLFSPDNYRPDRKGRKAVATRIEKFVATNGKIPKALEMEYSENF